MSNRTSPESFPGWPPSDGPAVESTPTGKKKKKSSSASPTKAESEAQPRDPDKAKRLGGLLVEREPDTVTPQPTKRGREKHPEPVTEDSPKREITDDEVKTAKDGAPAGVEETDLSVFNLPEATSGLDGDRVEKADRFPADDRKLVEESRKIDWSPKELPLNMLPGGEVFIDLGRPIPEREELFDKRLETTSDEPGEVPENLPLTTFRAAESLPQTKRPSNSSLVDRYPATISPPWHAEAVPPAPPEAEVSVPSQVFDRPVDRPMVRVAEQHPETAQEYHQPTATAVRAGESAASKRDVENAVYRAARAANRGGLFTGILVGGIYEHFKHKRRERRIEKRLKQERHHLQQNREDQRFSAAEQAKHQAQSERQLSSAGQRFTTAEQAIAAREEHAEKRFAALRQTISKRQKSVERADPEIPEQLAVPSEHRLQASAWLSTEVDKRTGLPVKPEQRTFVYGREYYRERAHETASAARRTAAAGEVALMGASAARVQRSASQSGAASGTRQSTSGAPTPGPSLTHRLKGLSDRKLRTVSTATGPIWPYVLTLAVIFVCLIALIH